MGGTSYEGWAQADGPLSLPSSLCLTPPSREVASTWALPSLAPILDL